MEFFKRREIKENTVEGKNNIKESRSIIESTLVEKKGKTLGADTKKPSEFCSSFTYN